MELSNRSRKKVESILINAENEFIDYGFNKVTMDSIAYKANVSKVTLYKYFSDKQVLYEHILKENYLKEFNEIERIIKSDMKFKEKLDLVTKTRLSKYITKKQLLMDENYNQSIDFKTFIKERAQIMNVLNTQLYDQGRVEGFIRDDLSDATLARYFNVIRTGLIHNFALLGELNEFDLNVLMDVLYAGVIGCNKREKETTE